MRWVVQLHESIGDLARTQKIARFEQAFVGVLLMAPSGYARQKAWDTDNRALHLVFNNLKGIFFPDDDFQHMAFGVFGRCGDREKTVILIGDMTQTDEITRSILGKAPLTEG